MFLHYIALVAVSATMSLTHASSGRGSGSDGDVGPNDWRRFRGDMNNSGRVNIDLLRTSSELRRPKEFKTQGLIWGSAVRDSKGNIYVGSADKFFYSLTPEGDLRWKYKLLDRADSLVDSAAVVTTNERTVVVPGGDGHLHALDTEDGSLRWMFKPDDYSEDTHQQGAIVNSFEGNVTEGPMGQICAGSDNGFFYCMNQDNGALNFKHKTGMMVWSMAAFNPQGRWLAFGSLDKHLYLLDAASGFRYDRFNARGEIKASPLRIERAGKEFLYFGDAQGDFYKLEVIKNKKGLFRFKQIWKINLGSEIYSSATEDHRHVYVATLGGKVVALTHQGDISWVYKTHSPVSSSPVLSRDGVLLVGAKNGKMYALDHESGTRMWSYATSKVPYKANLDASPMVTNDGMIVNGAYNGSIYMIPAETCLQSKPDACQYGGKEDIESVISELPDGVHFLLQNREGHLLAEGRPMLEQGLMAPIKLKLVVKQHGKWIPEMAVHAWSTKVLINGREANMRIGSDGGWIDILPNVDNASSTLDIAIKGGVYKRGGLIRDLFKWLPSKRFDLHVNVTLQSSSQMGEAMNQLLKGDSLLGVRSMALFRPASLDTYIPAAMDGQNFMIRMLQDGPASANRLKALVLPAYYTHGDYKVMPEVSKSFMFEGKVVGEEIVITSDGFKLSAMGATIPFEQARFNLGFKQGAPAFGEFFAETSCLKLKGNGMNYNFSMALIEATCDHRMKLVSLGRFESDFVSLPFSEVNASVNVAVKKGKSKISVELTNHGEKQEEKQIVHVVIRNKANEIVEHRAYLSQKIETFEVNGKVSKEQVEVYINGYKI